MQVYLVGGAVRDALRGARVHDRDWVAVGATPEMLTALGYLPVGKDFPVFLHPDTREEVALARTERKTAPGYHGFTFHADASVTLEDDLARRDLTINAMAQDDAGAVIDPHGGRRDLAAKVLRHVSPAFAEDPVRILRIARFAARFADFTVADDTMTLMRRMVDAGEVDALVSERVWQELARGLMEQRPSRMFEVLRDCGALARVLPEVDRLWGIAQPPEHHPEVDTGVHLMLVLDMAAQLGASLPVRYACLCHDLGKGTTPAELLPRHLGHEQRGATLARQVGERLRVPTECRALADVVAREHGNIHRSASLGADAVLRLLERCDALRRPGRWDDMLLACECDARGRAGMGDAPYPQRARLLAAQRLALSVDTAAVAAAASARGRSGPAIGAAVQAARAEALSAGLTQSAPVRQNAGEPRPPLDAEPTKPGVSMSDRIADHPVDPQFLQRWSPRAFTGETIDEATLLGFLEAARWAPSSYNMQPWRFIYARAGTPAWAPLFGTLIEWNQSWAKDASALVLVMSAINGAAPGQKVAHNPSHAFDAGAGWAYLALQASLAGWAAHGMGGFDRDKAKAALGIPAEGYMLHEVVAIGRRADPSVLAEGLRGMEQPSGRLPLSALAAEGTFAFGG